MFDCQKPLKFSLAWILLFVASVLFIWSFCEPAPGRHSWFTSLAGDWSVKIERTDFEIGNSPENRASYCIFTWKPHQRDNGDIIEVTDIILDDVVSYKAYNNGILAEVEGDDFFWIDAVSGVSSRIPEEEASSRYGVSLTEVRKELTAPRASMLYPLRFVSALLVIIAIYCFVSHKRSKRTAST